MARRKPSNLLVIGADGFVGEHLVADLLAAEHRIVRTVRPGREGRPCRWGLPSDSGKGCVSTIGLELPAPDRLREILREEKPAGVVYLAGRSFVPDAESDPAGAVAVNVEGFRGLCEALDAEDPDRGACLVYASTSHVYQRAGRDGPLTEASPVEPVSVYARSKLAAELLGQCLVAPASDNGRARSLVLFRAFNHAGPGQSARFVVANFARQLARAERGLQPPVIETGNLKVARDFTDVRDVARAYRLAAEGRVPAGLYNVASGRSVLLGDLLTRLIELSGARVEARPSPALSRSRDLVALQGSPERLSAVCGWTPRISLDETLRDVLDYWRREIRLSEDARV